jgi:hypothetical protein
VRLVVLALFATGLAATKSAELIERLEDRRGGDMTTALVEIVCVFIAVASASLAVLIRPTEEAAEAQMQKAGAAWRTAGSAHAGAGGHPSGP